MSEFVSTAVIFGCSMLALCFHSQWFFTAVVLMIPLLSRERRETDLKTLQQLRDRERELENELETETEDREREVTALTEEKKNNEQRIAEVRNSDNTDCLQTRFSTQKRTFLKSKHCVLTICKFTSNSLFLYVCVCINQKNVFLLNIY